MQSTADSVGEACRSIPKLARRGLSTIVRPALDYYKFKTVALPALSVPTDRGGPLVVAGLFSTASGVGEGARSTWRALNDAGLSPIAVDLSERFAQVDYRSDIPLSSMPEDADGTLILQVNARETLAALRRLGMRRGRNWYTVGYWAWELPTFPPGWEDAFPLVSEIWTVSNFAASAFRKGPSPPPVAVFGHAVSPPPKILADRAQFGLPEDAFVFLAFADSKSSIERKNPVAAIESHKRAFGDDPSSILLVKTRNLDRSPKARARLEAAVAGAMNVRLLDVSLSEKARWELLNAVDAVVSLHRAEGFGLVIAEAMALGKPAIATAWSGNMDFCTEESIWLVDSHLVETEDPYGVYSTYASQWAEVDLDHAAECFQTVRSDADKRTEKAAIARDTIAHLGSSKNLGESMRKHLFSDVRAA